MLYLSEHLYKCVYVLSISSILVCPKDLEIVIILVPLYINKEAHECLKSWILICLTPASSQLRFF